MKTIFSLLVYLIFQTFICYVIHIYNKSKIPKNYIEFLKLSWLPYVLMNIKEIKK